MRQELVWHIIRPITGGDAEVARTVLGGFLKVFSFLEGSGLTAGRRLGCGEGWPAMARIPMSGKGSQVQDSSFQCLNGAVRLWEVALLMLSSVASPCSSCSEGTDVRVSS